MSINTTHDVIVIGGGPAGMMTAGIAASRGLRVLLIEKNNVLGKKLSITGGGRCNITNAEFDVRALLKHYGDAEQFLFAPFAQFGVKETIAFFESLNVPIKIEDRKRAFPLSEKASEVTRALVEYLKKQRVDVLCNTRVQGFATTDGHISGVITDTGTYTAQAYVIASGGKSHTETGSTGEGMSWLSQIGHKVHESNPNLVPLIVRDVWVRTLSGTTLSNVKITFKQGTQTIKKQGNVLCTHFGFSGPLILNSAYEVKSMLKTGSVQGSVDLYPQDDVGTLRTRLTALLDEYSNKTLVNALREWFPKGIVDVILEAVEPSSRTTKSHSISREVRHLLVDRMKCLPFTVTGTMGYDWAVVSDGGVDLSEIDTRTMQSRIHKNLYLVGDILHVNRPSGGYSLQLCWTMGWVVGTAICKEGI